MSFYAHLSKVFSVFCRGAIYGRPSVEVVRWEMMASVRLHHERGRIQDPDDPDFGLEMNEDKLNSDSDGTYKCNLCGKWFRARVEENRESFCSSVSVW